MVKKPKAPKPDIEIGTKPARGDEPRRSDYPSSGIALTIAFAPYPARVKPKAPKPKRIAKK